MSFLKIICCQLLTTNTNTILMIKMEKKIIRGIFIILSISTLGCKTNNLPKQKKHQQMETFIEINGLKIPTLSEDKKFFKDTKAFKNDRKNSIGYGEASKMYKKNDDWQDNNDNMNSYQKATKDFLIVSENGNVYEDITYDINDKDGCVNKMKRYTFKGDKLYSFSNQITISINLNEAIEINGKRMTKVLSGFEYSCVYFPNGQLKSYSVYNGGLRIKDDTVSFRSNGSRSYLGTWYKFNENGDVIQTIDFEKDYKTSFLDVFFVTRKKINDLTTKGKYKYNRYAPVFERNKNELGAFWQLYISENYYMIIDDETGKVIEEVESADFDEVQKKFSKYMKPTIEYNKAINEFFENNLLPTSNN